MASMSAQSSASPLTNVINAAIRINFERSPA
jgi:hypothetical protein